MRPWLARHKRRRSGRFESISSSAELRQFSKALQAKLLLDWHVIHWRNRAHFFGTYQVNEDCSGRHELHIPDVPFPVTDRFVVVDHGREVRHFVVSPASVMVTGVSQKMTLW